MVSSSDVLNFWYGEDAQDNSDYLNKRSSVWFGKSEDFDRQVKEKFETGLSEAGLGKLDHWADSPIGNLALIILLDQFPRNIYRGNPKSYHFDEKARHWCLHGLDGEKDKELLYIQRVFFYLPLMHSETLAEQDRSVSLYQEMVDQGPEDLQGPLKSNLKYAILHRDIVKQFGRFPHRNQILGRETTPEEEAFLKTPNSSF